MDIQTVVAFLAKEMCIEESEVKPEYPFLRFDIDSLDLVEISMCAEERFDIIIPDADLPTMNTTVQEFFDYISKLKQGIMHGAST